MGGILGVIAALGSLGCGGESSESANPHGVELWGSIGRQPGLFSKPRAVAVSSEGEAAVADRTGRIQIFDSATGEFLRQWRLPAYEDGTPTGMSIDPLDDTLWIADTHYFRILHYDMNGNLLAQFGEEGEDPGQFVFVTDVAPDPNSDTLWITDYGRRNRVIQFTRGGEFIREWGAELYTSTDLNRPMAVAMSPDGAEVYVLDAGNHRINVYNPEAELLHTIGIPGSAPGKLEYPYDIAVAENGDLYLAEYGANRVSVYTPEGEFIGSIGGPGRGALEFASPWGLALDPAGTLLIADTENHRIHVVRNPARHFRRDIAEAPRP